jgi:hypothetical protein
MTYVTVVVFWNFSFNYIFIPISNAERPSTFLYTLEFPSMHPARVISLPELDMHFAQCVMALAKGRIHFEVW